MTDILSALLDACARTPDAPAITLVGRAGRPRRTLSFGELRDRILRIAGGLSERGLMPGERVLFSVRPGPDGICLALGIIAAGGTVVFADPGAGDSLFRARAALAAPRWVAAESLLYAASSGPLRHIARRRGIDLPDYSTVVPEARHIVAGPPVLPGVPAGAVSLRVLARSEPLPQPRGGAGDEALVIFTSGTTDHPKAVVHSRSSLGSGLSGFADHVGFVAGERVLTDQLMVGIPALIAGAHWVLPSAGADPGAKPERYLVPAEVLFAVPAALDALLGLWEQQPTRIPALRMLLIGGAPVLPPLLARARAQLPGTAIRAIYGMTEILPVAIADGDEKLGFTGGGDYVGELVSGVDARIEDGELMLSGPGLALGYLGDPPLVELATGDLARLQGAGLVLAGRRKDMFIRGTQNIYPGLYEPAIAALPGVREAVLVGIPNAIGDDAVVLVVVTDPGCDAENVRRALPGVIDAGALPDRIVVMAELPRSGRSRKVDRVALRELVTPR